MRVIVVAPNASARFGGEAILPLHYFRRLRDRGYDAFLVVHSRVQAELAETLEDQADRLHFIPDRTMHRMLHKLGKMLPNSVAATSTTIALDLLCQLEQRTIVRRLVTAAPGLVVVHQPTPVSPKRPSLIFGVKAPVVIGPMNGGMTYPPAFRTEHRGAELITRAGRWAAVGANLLLPGKRRAAVLLVANERTREALPTGHTRAKILVENGVDMDQWSTSAAEHDVPTFIFLGRLIQLKGVDMLLRAFASARRKLPMRLVIVGDGPERGRLEELARLLGVAPDVCFKGFVSQADCPALIGQSRALVLPSLRECGGAVVLEAMASGRPVVTIRWGGPADYVDEHCAILVEPSSRAALEEGLARGLARLAGDPGLALRLGSAGRRRVREEFDWERKIDVIIEVYSEALAMSV